MKKALLLASTILLTPTFSYAGGEGWMHDFEAAKKRALEEKKDLLIDFTGSDWCPPCQDLSARILSQESFKVEAAKNYILVELDFPNDKTKITPEISAQNQQLAEHYGIQGFPTILLTDAQGRPFGQTGHHLGGPQDYLDHLADLQKSKTLRDVAFAKAEKSTGLDKSRALHAALQSIPLEHLRHYPNVIETIKLNDPKDETGFFAEQARRVAEAKAQEEFYEKVSILDGQLDDLIADNQSAKALTLIDDFIESENLEGIYKQQTLAIKISILAEEKDYRGVETVISEIIAVDPDSEFSNQAISFRENYLKKYRETHPASLNTEQE